MLLTLSALVVGMMSGLFQGAGPTQAASAASPTPRSLTSRDSTRALRVAHKAQAEFETLRRRLLPYQPLAGGDCDATVGRYCHRQEFATPPEDAPEVVFARARLLTTLDSIGALMPGDRWIVGQRVRYLMEAKRPLVADSVAIACAARSGVSATSSWCLALIGYTAQQLGNYTRADAAFTSALAQMSPAERCKWQDPTVLLGRSAGVYRDGGCEARDSIIAGFWRLVQPMYLMNVNDLRTECLARITRMYIERDTRTPMSDWWGSEERATLLRYGVSQWYTRGDVPRGQTTPAITGFRREPAFNFFPDARAFSSPDELTDEDWDFWNPASDPTYAPIWATSFRPLADHQVALFRRGDSAFIVAAFDADDAAPATALRRAGTFVAIVDHAGVLTPFGTETQHSGVGTVSTMMAPWRPFIVSLESLNPSNGAAQRTRFAPKLPHSSGRLSLSDLLLYAPRDSTPTSLDAAVPRVLHALRAPSDRQIGVFWETYGVRSEGESVDYALLVTPADEGFFHRAMVKLHVADPERSASVQWREMPSVTKGIASRGMTVDLSHLRPGRYSVRLMLTSGTDAPVLAERTIEIL